MVIRTRTVKCSDRRQEIWSYLRRFQDEKRACARITEIHKIGPEHEQNAKKQAEQISFSLQQAEEYFASARVVSLSTKPLLFYYGAVSLAQAVILLRNDGRFSLDRMRHEKKHRHHGLELKGFQFKKETYQCKPEDIFKSIACSIHLNEGKPWGQFPLFYKAIFPAVYRVPYEITHTPRGITVVRKETRFCSDHIPIESIKDRSFSLWEVISKLPDCYDRIGELGANPQLARGTIKAVVKIIDNSDGTINKTIETHRGTIDAIQESEKTFLLEYWKKKNSPFKVIADGGHNLIIGAHFEGDGESEPIKYYYPDLVEDLFGRQYYIINPEEYQFELAGIYQFLFCTGMLARYWPDFWVNVTKRNVEFREIIGFLLDMIEVKFPGLILDQLLGEKIYFDQ